MNTLKAMIPDLEEPTNVLLQGAQDLGGGYVLLKARQKNATRMCEHEAVALRAYCLEQGHDLSDSCDLRVLRWAGLQVPTGQVARSLWKESLKAINQVRMARNVKVMLATYYLFVN